jgi:glycosyltransferase involved in cell wall biosynthesis
MRQTPDPTRSRLRPRLRLVFDLSDLVCYLSDHANLSGIQRVQSSIVLALLSGALAPDQAALFVSFNTRSDRWEDIPADVLKQLLLDLFRPEAERVTGYDRLDARAGILPGTRPFDGVGQLDDGVPSVFCLLGAGWIQPGYNRRVLALKRRFGTRFVMMVHDLVAIYAPHLFDPVTASAFEIFMRRAVRLADHCLAVSEHTARDLNRYVASLSLPPPAISVTRNGSSFDAFLPASTSIPLHDLPSRFVLFVATIEGRKNHRLMLDIWLRMLAAGQDPPHLVCVGRIAWRAERFITGLVESAFADGRIVLLQDVSDETLRQLYAQCLFTVYPSFYEGWGLPVGEALAVGKICVCAGLTSLPEVAGGCGTTIDVDDPDMVYRVISTLIVDEAARLRQEATIREHYRPVTWAEVAGTILAACEQTAMAPWTEPGPYPHVPYGMEIGFADSGLETGLTGADLLTRLSAARAGHFLSRPLTEAALLLGEEIRGAGRWGHPEHWGTWLCQGSGDIVLSLAPNDDGLLFVALLLSANGVASALPLQIVCDGKTLWSGALGERPRNILLTVPRQPAARGTWWRLRIVVQIEPPPEMLAAIGGADTRIPLIGVMRLVVVPHSDVTTRLELLTKLVPM